MPTPPLYQRPTPQIASTPTVDTVHGAPLARRGELAAATRDATFLSSPSLRIGGGQVHVAVHTHRYAVTSGGMRGLGAACDPVHILLDEGMLFSAHELKKERCRRGACQALFAAADRQHEQLEHIRSYYALKERHGIDVGLGMRVRHDGRPGTIIDTSGQYLVVRLDDGPLPVRCHATAHMEYEVIPDEWVAASPITPPNFAGSPARP